ncbi:RidA family protein [Zunongwangia sp. HRR-M8]|uniref:RidA family protein n=1 Tax=Zunongwangia sp. HRR-M8 TaxID=3015170 RepID=UPI0022DCE528|nr:RidA family protein [Zunongwangia sp. HRR-M8]WBL22555.1 RidA family protein [Zunongwangia sp. HRR-M8]
MEKRTINPWQWQDARSYVQAAEVKKVSGTLYVSGQTAIDDQGVSSNENMEHQMIQALENLEKVIKEAQYECKNIVRLNIYTTSSASFFENFGVFQRWAKKHNLQQASSVLEVKSLFESLKVEFEATVVK